MHALKSSASIFGASIIRAAIGYDKATIAIRRVHRLHVSASITIGFSALWRGCRTSDYRALADRSAGHG